MKKFKELSEAIKDKFDIGEYDQEGDMAKSDLRIIIANAQKLHDMLDDADNLPEWVQSKITKAEDYITTVANYMTAEMSEEVEQIDELSSEMLGRYKKKASDQATEADKSGDYKKGDKRFSGIVKATNKQFANDMKKHQKEEVENLEEKNVPTSPEKWSRAKAMAKQKFDVYPSAYANGWAAKKYKEMGGDWKSVNEAKEDDLPFTPDKSRKPQAVAGKHGIGYSTAKHLAKMAMKKQTEKMKKPIKEEEMSKKAQIVKKLAKKKESSDTFQDQPVLSSTITKNN
jgi:hypothetical protein